MIGERFTGVHIPVQLHAALMPTLSSERTPASRPRVMLCIGASRNKPRLSITIYPWSDLNHHERFQSRPEVSQVVAFPSQI